MVMWRKFFRFPASDRWLLAEATVRLALYAVALRVFPAQALRRFVCHQTDLANRGRSADPMRIAWSVRTVSRYVPGNTCLTRGMATVALLRRHRIAADLRFGVAKSDGKIEAHAWVESDGVIVMGKVKELSRFAPFPLWQTSSLPKLQCSA